MIDELLDVIMSEDATDYHNARRWRATASTWFKKVAASLRWQHEKTESDSLRYLIAEEAARLLYEVLSEAQRLVPLLRDDTMHEFKWVEREALALVKELRNERLARKMDDTAGRTPVEAAAFKAKATELRS